MFSKIRRKTNAGSTDGSLPYAVDKSITILNFCELEPRIAFDAAMVETAAIVTDNVQTDTAAETGPDVAETLVSATSVIDEVNPAPILPALDGRQEIIFIDPHVTDVEQLISGIDPAAEVIFLSSDQDGIEQISSVLAGRNDIDAIHIIAHGDAGQLNLGTGVLNADSIRTQYHSELSEIGAALDGNADILIYGCNFGEGEIGEEAVAGIAELTGADIAASDDITGHKNLGGDWDLEVQHGAIEAGVFVSQTAQMAWVSSLDTTTFAEGASGYSGTHDTELNASTPDTNYGNDTQLVVADGTPNSRTILIRFDNVFGNGAGQIPLGSTINAAELRVNVVNTDPGETAYIHRMLANWDESTATYNSMGSGVSLDDVEAASVASDSLDAGLSGTQAFNVLADLQAWSAGGTNHGWSISTDGTGAVDWTIASSEDGTAGSRPVLYVDFTPPNQAPVITSNGGGSSAAVNVLENQNVVTTVTSTDSDGGTPVYSISGGADSAQFNINSSTGDLTFVAAPDFEGPTDSGSDNTYDVQVQVDDGNGGTDTQDIAVTVTNANDAPTGVPTISGTPTEDQTLTADTSGIADADGLGTFAYQWYRDGVAITGATASTYTLSDADVGTAITVSVAYTDGNGTSEGPLTSSATAPVVNVNDAPVGVPTISGTPTEDQTLTADTSGIADADGLGTFAYQWYRDGVAITGATASTYTLGDADVGTAITVSVTYTDGNGTLETITSAATAPVVNVNDAPTGVPVISGTPTEDQTLTADTSGIADADGLGTFAYQWHRDGLAITGATASTYTLGDADVGTAITVSVTYTDGNGTSEGPLTSSATAPVVNVNDAPVGIPTISGTPTEDQTLTADTSGISDADGLGTFAYQWYRDTGSGPVAITGATAMTYTLGDSDVTARISVTVDYTDGQGTVESLSSAQTAPIVNVNDAPTGIPLITGIVTEDQTLTADTSGIADADGLGAFSYQWYRDGVAITGATASTYTLGDADVGTAITVSVTYTDGNGTLETITSAATAPVVNVNDAPTGVPVISGTPTEDQTLTADTSGIADADGLGTFAYQWYRDTGSGPVAITGATAMTYTLGDSDVTARISVTVDYTDGQGTVESLSSAQTAPIVNVNDAPTGIPLITGIVTEDQTLTADTSGIADSDGLGAFSYQWYRDTGSGPVAITDATASTYTLGDLDVGAQMTVEVTYTDGWGTAEGPLTSSATAPVVNVNDGPMATGNTVVATENTAFVFAVSDFNFTDVEGDPMQSVTISNLNLNGGTLTHSGGTVTVTDGLTLTPGQLADLTFTPATNSIATATFDYRVNDTSSGYNTATMNIFINQAGVVVNLTEDNSHTFSFSEFTSNTTATEIQVTALTIPTGASLELNGSSVSVNDIIQKSDIDAGLLVFTPAPDGNGSGYANIDFLVSLPTTNILAGEPNSWTLGNAATQIQPTEDRLADPNHFGPAGTVPTTVNVVEPQTTIDAAYLSLGGVLFDGYVSDSNYSAQELSAIDTWVQNGGVLIANSDDTSHDRLSTHFGLPVAGTGSNWTVANTTHDIMNGPFGSVGSSGGPISTDAAIGYFDENDLQTGDVVLAQSNGWSSRPSIVLRTYGSGHILFIADVDIFQAGTSFGTGMTTPNDKLIGNIFAWAIENSSENYSGSLAVNISPVNDAPVNSVPGTLATDVDTSITLAQSIYNAIQISDVDAATNPVTVTLTTTNGHVTLSGTTGLSFAQGDGTADPVIEMTGTQTAINSALDGLVFTPDNGFSGQASIAVETDDTGNSGSGGALVANDTVYVQVGAASFQQGVDGYTGTEDTYLDSDFGTTSFGNQDFVLVDDTNPVQDGLLRFDNLFGGGASQVPVYSTIHSATISVYVTGTDPNDTVFVHEMLSGWNESSTHNSMGSGIQTNDVEAASTAFASIDSGQGGWIDITLPASMVQGWADGGTNNGIALVTNNADVWTFASSEHSNINIRPYITIDYSAPVAPTITSDGGGGSAVVAVAEGQTGVTTVTSSDPDGGTPVYSISGGADAALFSINPSTGVLVFNSAPDHESPADADSNNIYEVTVQVDDGRSGVDTQTIDVTITNVNEVPVATGNTVAATEDVPYVFSVSDFSFTDIEGDPLQSVTITSLNLGGGTLTHTGGTVTVTNGMTVTAAQLADLTFTTALNNHANTSFDYTVNDADLGVVAATMNITVAAVNDAPTGVPVISGTATEDQTLTADTSGIADADGLGTFAYQWHRDGLAVTGATASTYTLGDADVGAQMTVEVTYTDGNGTLETITSAATAPVVNVNDAPTGFPVISGTPTEDQTLTADTSGIADADGLGTFSYQWYRDGVAITGATASTYTLGDADVGAQMTVEVTYTDGWGTVEGPLTSSATTPVVNVNDAPVGIPTISGTPTEDQTLTADASGIADSDGLGTFSYQWYRNTGSGPVAITGATALAYTLGDADVGANISVQVSYTDGGGTSENVMSAQTAPIVNVNDAPTGVPVISGTVTEDQTLTADTSGIADADGLGTFAYQWYRDGVAITGATASTYTLGDADVGTAITVNVTYTDGNGTSEGPLTSSATAPVANVNDAPTGFPVISGTPTEDQTLTADTSGIADADGLGTFAYQWHRDGVAITGATASTYTLGDADVGTAITVSVTYTDGNGTSEGPLTSSATAPVVNVNDAPTGVPVISGTPTEDQTLTADASGIADSDGLGTFSYQWYRDTGSGPVAITGATALAYTLGDADVGASMSVQVAYTDGGGTSENVMSAQTAPIVNVNDAPTGVPVISGTVTEDQTLTADTSGIADADGLGTFAYQWYRDGVAITGATASTYTLGDADVGTAITVNVTYTDGNGTSEGPLTSSATAPVANVNDAPTGFPVISGTPTEDQTLTADTSGIADADGLGTFAYQWHRDGVAITGATASTYTLGDADVGTAITVSVTYTDGNGTSEGPLTSSATAPVTNVNDAPVGIPTISGTPTEDQTLTADTSGIADADGLGTFAYQWHRDGVAITGAIASTYTLGDADVGTAITVSVTYTDGNGTLETITSAATAPVVNVNDAPTGVPVISGTPTEDQTLTADTSGIADADGLGAFSYQWYRDGVAITGATASTYTLGDADVGTAITVSVTYTDGNGTSEGPLTSSATAPVVNVNDAPVGIPTISGTPTEDQTLTADTSGISDADGLGTFAYQWYRDTGSGPVAITGATAMTYTLGDSDVTARISVTVDYTDGQGTVESLSSAQTAPIVNVNDAPTGIPLITGIVTEDQTLTADTSGIADADGLGAFSYQWYRDTGSGPVVIVGANGASYTLGDNDVAARMSVEVTYTDVHGTSEGPLVSAQTTPVVNVNDLPVATGNTVTTDEDTAFVFNVADFAFTDIEGDPLQSVTISNLNLSGGTLTHSSGSVVVTNGMTVTLAQLADLTFQPAFNSFANVSFDYAVNDADSGVAVATMTIVVNPVNDVPIATGNTLVTDEDVPLVLNASDFLFTDVEGNALQSVRIDNLDLSGGTLTHSGGTVAVSNNSVLTAAQLTDLTFTPSPDNNSDVSFDYAVNDVDNGITFATMNIIVNPVNDAPVITFGGSGAVSTTSVDENTTGDTLISTVDVDGDVLTYSIVGGADQAAFSIAPDGTLTFDASPDFETPTDADNDGVYEVIVQVSDGAGGMDTQTIVVVVDDVDETTTATDSDDGPPETIEEENGNLVGDGISDGLADGGIAGKEQSALDLIGTFASATGAGAAEQTSEEDEEPDQPPEQPFDTLGDTLEQLEEFDIDSDFLSIPEDLVFKPVEPKVRLDLEKLNKTELWKALDENVRDLQESNQILGVGFDDLSTSAGAALSTGFVAWVLRGSALTSTLIASIPAWQRFDPIVIFVARDSRNADNEDGSANPVNRLLDRIRV